jgi:hypothetical protein
MAYHFQISAQILSWPRMCACCGETADSSLCVAASKTTGTRVQHKKTSWWDVPYCATCLAHKALYESAVWWLRGGLATGIVLWIFVGRTSGSGIAGFIVGVITVGASFWLYGKAQSAARAQMKASCCTPTAAVRYLDWHGNFHTFVFESESYTDEFLAANSRKTRSDVQQV